MSHIDTSLEPDLTEFDIAIIGMAGRFPKARNIGEYWTNLVDGTDCVTWFSRDELAESGVPEELLDDPNFVPASPVLEDADRFDAEFFGYSPKEAKAIDPQQRHLLECGWLAIENAGYDPRSYDGRIGVFAGTAMNTYFINTGLSNNFSTDYLPTLLGNDKDFVATRLSYKLGLQGPALTVQTACSTSLVAIHYACQSILSGESDMALVGAAAVRVPLKTGHLFEDASVFTPDGKCRAFDENAAGTIFGSGAGAVLLKRATDALRDGDPVRAIIRGSAVNNDGDAKSDFTAPSVSMQAAAIGEAMAAADVTADSIDYVEAHGTGTFLGDPIEVAALTQAYRNDTDLTGYCRIGSVKSNVGHLDAAAGMAALIKVVLSLENETIPKTLHYDKPNPQIDFASSPFSVAAENTSWPRSDRPRRAGITSLGMGGTNAHLIIEEGLPRPLSSTHADDEPSSLRFSARNTDALDRFAADLATLLEDKPEIVLEDAATALMARTSFSHHRVVHAPNRASVIDALRTKGHPLAGDYQTITPGEITFMFTGQGAQRAGMGGGLYESAPVFRDSVDQCAELFAPHIDTDVRAEMWPDTDAVEAANERLAETWLTQPALFTIEYSLARWWISQGVTPAALIGHSIGELTAAAVSGMFSLEDAVRLVAIRAKSMFDAPRGSMIAVESSESAIAQFVSESVQLAVQNGANSLVLAGPDADLDAVKARLDEADIAYRELRTSHAFHTATMESAAEAVVAAARDMTVNEPTIPVISNLHGGWLQLSDVRSGQYWGDHVLQPVRFADGLTTLLQSGARSIIEVGPAATLVNLVRSHPDRLDHHHVRSTLPPRAGVVADVDHAKSTLEWLRATAISDDVKFVDPTGVPIELPGYPFARDRYWFTPPAGSSSSTGLTAADLRRPTTAEWVHVESFAPTPARGPLLRRAPALMIGTTPSPEVGEWLAGMGSLTDSTGTNFTAESFATFLAELDESETLPERIFVIWSDTNSTEQALELIGVARSLTRWDMSDSIELVVITEGAFDPLGTASSAAGASLALGPVRAVNAEMDTISARLVDVGPNATVDLFAAAVEGVDSDVHTVQHNHRWIPQYLPAGLAQAVSDGHRRIAIVGGFGGVGVELAKHFIERGDAVTLTSSRPIADEHRQTIDMLGSQASALSLPLIDEAAVVGRLSSAGPFDFLIHLGGVIDNGLLATKETEKARAVLEPKVRGSQHLLAAAKEIDAELILFSSIAATHPGPGQVDYSAATAFQQGLAAAESRVRAIAFPAWTGTGMTNLLTEADQAKAKSSGIEPAEAIGILEQFLADTLSSVIISPIPLELLDVARSGPAGSTTKSSGSPLSIDTEGLTETEAALALIWSNLTGHEQIDAADKFPDLGGTSLMAVKMFTQIDRQFGVELPVETVLEAPSLAELAAVVDSRVGDTDVNVGSNGQSAGASPEPPKSKSMVRVRPGGEKTLYLAHAHGGTVLSYERLARFVDEEITVVGFQSLGIEGVTEPLTTIEDMARHYVKELREFQPHGPYHLGGFCMGGTIAWEMAAQLIESGDHVENLFMIQAFSREFPEYPDDDGGSKIARATRDQMSLARLDEDGGDGAMAKASALARGVKSTAYTKLMRLAEPVASGRRTILSRIGRINDEAFWNYEPRQLEIDVEYLPATIQPDGAIKDDTLGFSAFHSGDQRIQEISGHFSGRFIELDLETTAEIINDRMVTS